MGPRNPTPSNKRRKITGGKITVEKVEEVKFDFSAREEYLSGFHKRKVQREKHAKEAALRREKEEKKEARKMVCWFCSIVY
jgi:ribosomal RNA-processing protein 17